MTTITTKIFDDNYTTIVNHINWKISNLEDAKDIAQDVFIKADRLMKDKATAFNSEQSSISTWLRTICNCAIIDYYRTNHSSRFVTVSKLHNDDMNLDTLQFVASQTEDADSLVLNKEMNVKMIKAFRGLKPAYRRIAVMYFLNDRKYEEIAEVCNVPMGTVKGMISRARTMLQNDLGAMYPTRSKVALA